MMNPAIEKVSFNAFHPTISGQDCGVLYTQREHYVLQIPCIRYAVTLEKTHYTAISYLSTCMFCASLGLIFARQRDQESQWMDVFAFLLGGLATFVLIVIHSFCKEQSEESKGLIPAQPSTEESLTPEELQLVNELCSNKTSELRIHEIIAYARKQNRLTILNSLPPIDSQHCGPIMYSHTQRLTPLQYWASQGNLPVTTLLKENSASDYCQNHETSALFEAAFHGHREIVTYLLSQEVHAHIAFRQTPLFYFVPQFIFEMVMCKPHFDYEPILECLNMVLSDLFQKKTTELAFQFKVPIDEQEVNILVWLEKMEKIKLAYQPMIQAIKQLLTQYGASQESFTKVELSDQGWDLKAGATLDEIAHEK